MKWLAHKSAGPVSSEMLRKSGAQKAAEIEALGREATEIVAALPNLVSEPDRAREAEVALREIEATLPHRRRALAAIVAAIPEAEEREEREKVEAAHAALEADTVKRSRGFVERYSRAAAAFASVLSEMSESEAAWQRLRLIGDIAGQRLNDGSLETRLRPPTDQGNMVGSGWRSLHDEVIVRAWDGAILFEGAKA